MTLANFYVTGGALKSDVPCYVERQADHDLFHALMQGEYCYVLTARQMGKSSLMVRTAHRLKREGVTVAILDFTGIGQNLTVEQWYLGMLEKLGQQLNLEDELEKLWLAAPHLGPLQRWMRCLRRVALGHCSGPLVVFIDEIDAVRSLKNFNTDEFFAAIRECYNRRSDDPDMGRLTFCLIGVASPSDLIANPRTTPFNIGRRIELTDFTLNEAQASLAQGLHPQADVAGRLLERIYYWTGGHPYLTQRLCRTVAEKTSLPASNGAQTSPSTAPGQRGTAPGHPPDIDRLCDELFLSDRARERDGNLQDVSHRILLSELDKAALLDLFDQIRRGKRVPDDEANPPICVLRLSGIVCVRQGVLHVRNRIYGRVFDRAWIRTNMPGAELRRQQRAFRRGLLIATAVVAAGVGIGFYVNRELQLAARENGIQQDVLEAAKLEEPDRAKEKLVGAQRVLDEDLPGYRAAGLREQVKRELERVERELKLLARSEEKIRKDVNEAAKLETEQKFSESLAKLDEARRQLDEKLPNRATGLRTQVQEGLARLETQRAVQDRRARFQKHYHDALLYHTMFDGVGFPDRRPKSRGAVGDALKKYDDELFYRTMFVGLNLESRRAQARDAAGKALDIYPARQRTDKDPLLQLGQLQQLFPDLEAVAQKTAPRGDWLLTALEMYSASQFEKVIEVCDKALKARAPEADKAQPNRGPARESDATEDFWANYLTSLSLLRQGKWQDAEAGLVICWNLRRDLGWPRLLRAVAMTNLDNLPAAEKEFELALEHKEDPLVQYLGFANRAVLNLRRGWQATARRQESYWKKAEHYLSVALELEGKWRRAAAPVFVAANEKAFPPNTPEGFQLHLHRAQVFRGLGKLGDALTEMDRAVLLAPSVPVVYEFRGRLHRVRMDWTKAREDFKQAVMLDANGSEPERLVDNLVDLARLLHRQGDYRGAMEKFKRALVVEPNLARTELFRVDTLLALNLHDEAGRALDSYLDTIRPTPASADVYRKRGLIHLRKQELTHALVLFSAALSKDEKDNESRRLRAWTFLQKGYAQRALEDFDECLKKKEKDTDALIGRGNARAQLKRAYAAMSDKEGSEVRAKHAHLRAKPMFGALEDAELAEKQGGLEYHELFYLACIYAQTAAEIDAETRPGRLALNQADEHRRKAIKLLFRALEKAPRNWHKQLRDEPALASIRRTPEYALLEARYAGNE